MTGQNGTSAAPGAMPIKSVSIKLDDIGYPGWEVNMRTNPRAFDYDNFVSQDEKRHEQGWQALIISWNLRDEKGKDMPIPANGTKIKDIPYDIQTKVVSGYIEAFNAATALPKPPANSSGTSSLTSAAT
jgi:hypothetical protein